MNKTKRVCTQLVAPCGHRASEYKLHMMSIGPGPQGTLETLRMMKSLVLDAMHYQDFCDFMSEIICDDKRLHSISPDGLDGFLRSQYRYVPEQIETLLSPAYNVWQWRQTGRLIGDCDDISMVYAAVFIALGYKCRFVALRTKLNDPEFYHVVTDCQIGDRWKRYDATVSPSTIRNYYGQMVVEI